jgi:aminoglycoside 3-N-acetyltransferase
VCDAAYSAHLPGKVVYKCAVTTAAAPDLAVQTRDSLATDLRRLGVRPGDALLVHSSLRSLGWVCGGATAVVQALLDVLGAAGTLVTPAQTARNRDPSTWTAQSVPTAWWPTIRENLPGYHPLLSPSENMGVVAECVRTWPGAIRSAHPQTSFAAIGPLAGSLLSGHALDSQLGEESPLARLEDVDAKILLLGVGFERCTAFHLAEYRLPRRLYRKLSCAVLDRGGGRRWVDYVGLRLDAGDFATLGAEFEARSGVVVTGDIGSSEARLFPLRVAVEFARTWLSDHRR